MSTKRISAHLAPLGEAYDTTITGQTFRVTDIAYEARGYHDGVQTACFAIGITNAGEYKTTEIDLTEPPSWCPPVPVWFAEIASDMEKQVKHNAA